MKRRIIVRCGAVDCGWEQFARWDPDTGAVEFPDRPHQGTAGCPICGGETEADIPANPEDAPVWSELEGRARRQLQDALAMVDQGKASFKKFSLGPKGRELQVVGVYGPGFQPDGDPILVLGVLPDDDEEEGGPE